MAAARQRAEWLRVGIAVSWIVNRNGWTKDPVSPLAIIPEQFRPEDGPRRKRTAAEIDHESRLAWRALDAVFSKMG